MESPRLPAELASCLSRLDAAGMRAHVVGGVLRDVLLDREPRDLDVVVEGSLEDARRALPDSVAIAAQLPVLAVVGGPHRIEISALRAPARNLEQDLRLRDFTVNAIAWSPRSGWFDPLAGREDLAARRLRACAPERGFRDDPVRVLRALRMQIELGLALDPETGQALERDHWRLAAAAGERLREELFRMLSLGDAHAAIEGLRRSGALAVLLPELLRCVGIAQNRHHKDDVYRHTLLVCQALRPDPVLRLAALLHDTAKPETKGFLGRGGETSFHRHEHRAAGHVKRVAARLRLSRREERRVAELVRHHLLFPERLEGERARRRMLRRVGRDMLPDLLELRRADLASRGPVPRDWELCESALRELARRESDADALAINGEDVMRELGVEHGPGVGRWLARARRRVLEEPGENQRERLLDWLRREAGS